MVADPPDAAHYAGILERMIGNRALRENLGEGASHFALQERSGEQAAQKLRDIVDAVFARRRRGG